MPKDLFLTPICCAHLKKMKNLPQKILHHFLEFKRRRALRARLIAGYKANAERDLAITKEWEHIDDETWLLHVPPYEIEEKPPQQSA
jgi:hypothetical protein